MLTTPDHADAVTSVPTLSPVGPKPRGFYLDCDPGTGGAGTVLRAEDWNELILNLRQLVFSAANVTPAKGAATMLKAALDRLYAGAVHTVVASQTLTPDYAGLVLVDATTSAINLTMPAAAACPLGSPSFTFVRTDSSTNLVRVIAAGSDVVVRTGTLPVTLDDPLTIRSDGVLRWYLVSGPVVVLRGSYSLYVNPTTGSDTPGDPFAGQAFKTIPQAMAFINRFVLAAGTVVTINVSAATHVFTAPLIVTHPQADQIGILGAGSASTILQFNGCQGLSANADMPALAALTIRGSGPGATIGIGCKGYVRFDQDVVVETWSDSGVIISPNGYMVISAGYTLTVRNCGLVGVSISSTAFLEASSPNTKILGTATAGMMSDGHLVVYGSVSLYELQTSGGAQGLGMYTGTAQIHKLNIRDASPGGAVGVYYNSFLKAADPAGPAGNWIFANAAGTVFHTLYVNLMSNVIAWGNMAVGNRSLTTPAINTVGNAQSYIQSS